MKKKRKNNTNTFYSIISTTLVLYMLGLFTFIFLNANSLSKHFKENLEVNIILNDNIKDKELLEIQNLLTDATYTKTLSYTTKEDAKAIFVETFNEDFENVLGYNPLFASLDLKLNAVYANADSIELIKSKLEKNTFIQEIYYQKNLVKLVNENLKFIGYLLIGISILFLIVTFSLIDNTIKLSMYSQRFIIRSMQLVGATKKFITKPFLKTSINNGILAAVMAIFLLTATLLYIQLILPEMYMLKDFFIYILVVVFLILIGVLVSWFSTKRSVAKYIKMKLDELY